MSRSSTPIGLLLGSSIVALLAGAVFGYMAAVISSPFVAGICSLYYRHCWLHTLATAQAIDKGTAQIVLKYTQGTLLRLFRDGPFLAEVDVTAAPQQSGFRLGAGVPKSVHSDVSEEPWRR